MAAPLLLDPEHKRMSLLPIRYPDLWDWYKRAQACFWVVGEVDVSIDLDHWRSRLDENERHFVSVVLAFFAVADSVVADNLAERFSREVQLYEAKCFYACQANMENIHAEMYGLLIETYVSDEEERMRLFDATMHFPCIQQKVAWAERWIDSGDDCFARRLVAFSVVEGVFFSGSFCAIFWLKQRGLMPGLSHANQLISRDEGMHQEFAAHLYTHYVDEPLPHADVHEIVDSAVRIETAFCTEALPVKLIGMNASDMATYIRFVADRLLTQLGVPPLYRASNPFPWMVLQSLEGKTNFFERRVSEYQKAGAHALEEGFTTDETF